MHVFSMRKKHIQNIIENVLVLHQAHCEIVIYNKKYIFACRLHSWHRAPKTLGIFYMKREIKVSLAIHNKSLSTTCEFTLIKVTFGKLLRMEVGWLPGQLTG